MRIISQALFIVLSVVGGSAGMRYPTSASSGRCRGPWPSFSSGDIMSQTLFVLWVVSYVHLCGEFTNFFELFIECFFQGRVRISILLFCSDCQAIVCLDACICSNRSSIAAKMACTSVYFVCWTKMVEWFVVRRGDRCRVSIITKPIVILSVLLIRSVQWGLALVVPESFVP